MTMPAVLQSPGAAKLTPTRASVALGSRIWARLSTPLLSLAILGVAVGGWQLGVELGASPLILPPPVEVLEAFWSGLFSAEGTFLRHMQVTLLESLIGFVLGLVGGVVVGALLSYSPRLDRASYPYIMAFQTFPKIAIAPLLVTWLGFGIASKAVIAAILAFFPILVNIKAGLGNVDSDMLQLMRSMRATQFQQLRWLRVPNALAYLFPALDTAIVLSLLGAVAGELVGAKSGLGYLLLTKTFTADIAAVYAVMLLLGIIGISLHLLAVTVKRKLLFWQ